MSPVFLQFLEYLTQEVAEDRACKALEPELHGQVTEGLQLGSAMTPAEIIADNERTQRRFADQKSQQLSLTQKS
jgi:hypothetical protein